MNYDQMTVAEMKEIYSRLGKEIEKAQRHRKERRLEEVGRSNSTFH